MSNPRVSPRRQRVSPSPRTSSAVTGDGAASFTVLAAAELYGEKVNIELSFATPPGLKELNDLILSTFSLEHAVHRPEGHPTQPFAIEKLQLFDEVTQSWSDLTAADQLRSWCQVYALQRETPWHRETQKPLPPPQKPMRAALPDTNNPTEKARAVFDELDINGDRWLEPDELRRGLRVLNVEFDGGTVDEVFAQADGDGDGLISPEEWERFSVSYPTLVDCLYYRSRDYWDDFRKQQDVRSAAALLENAREQRRQTALLLAEAQRDVQLFEEKAQQRRQRHQEHMESARRAEAALEQAQQHALRASEQRARVAAEVSQARDQEERQLVLKQEADDRMGEADRRLRRDELDLAEEEQRVRELQAALAEAQRSAAQKRTVVESSRKRVQSLQQKGQQQDAQLQRTRQELAGRARREQQAAADEQELEQRVRDYRALTADAAATCREHEADVARVDDELRQVRDRADARRSEAGAAREEEEAAGDRVQVLESALAEQRERKQAIERQEQPLLDEEVALYRQRQAITRRERELRRTTAARQQASPSVGRAPTGGSAPRTAPAR